MNNLIKNLKVGTDPELFFKKDNKPYSAEGLVGGTKDSPLEIGLKGFSLQEDNVMAEFNIPPSTNKEEFDENILIMIDHLETIAFMNGLELLISPSAKFDDHFLKTSQAMEFGCSPDFNAYTMTQNKTVSVKENKRFAGGHIHIGYDNPTISLNLKIVRALDIFLGLPSLFKDNDEERCKYYGDAGSYRKKDYGVEYRTLSNFWIKDSKSRQWVFSQIERAIEFINSNIIMEIDDNTWNLIELAINDRDKSLALSLKEKLEKKLLIKQIN